MTFESEPSQAGEPGPAAIGAVRVETIAEEPTAKKREPKMIYCHKDKCLKPFELSESEDDSYHSLRDDF